MNARPLILGPMLFCIGAAGLLSACGKVGDLERPSPMFRKESSTDGSDSAMRRASDKDIGPDTLDPRDRYSDPAPPRTLPIEGSDRGPGGVAPAGALPDPYARPR
ncbi:MAG: hypothetical protein IT546_12030 [Caulobacteraceae bacterium]|nr:hypothetical protein [Caulobacteraceae bacterium]